MDSDEMNRGISKLETKKKERKNDQTKTIED
jgi:hypothetical protein